MRVFRGVTGTARSPDVIVWQHLEASVSAGLFSLRIKRDGQVLDVFGEPIKRLYAAGEMNGGVHGAAYMTGTAFGKALSFGRLAARAIAKS